MNRLPDELITHIFSFLAVDDIVRLQRVSSRFLSLARDDTLWKGWCFHYSRAEGDRRRQQLLQAQDARLATLRDAISATPNYLPPYFDTVSLQRDIDQMRDAARRPEHVERNRALANWEPVYPNEQIDYYEEYVQRHASVSTAWLDLPKAGSTDNEEIREATGAALLDVDTEGPHAVAPLNDGSIVIYDLASLTPTNERLLGHSGPGLLTPGARNQTERHALMTDTGAVESVSVDPSSQRGFFASASMLHEVDLNSLSLVSSKRYPFPITALSACDRRNRPLVVGTNNTVHIYDARDSAMASPSNHTIDRTEQIAGPASTLTSSTDYATLSQPGPLSILHPPIASDAIWVAGRFTSLLQYSLRSFPRLLSTLHSGARISSLTSLPYPMIPQSLDLLRNPNATLSEHAAAKSAPGWTTIGAGEYKGKGSLELYEMGPGMEAGATGERYINRQRAGASKLLCVAPHGGKLVYGDGDGNLRWVERDGVTVVRTWNINATTESSAADEGIWRGSAADAPGQGDIVQKIVPLRASQGAGRRAERLLLWSGDGRVGVLGFGPDGALPKYSRGGEMEEEEWHDAVESQAHLAEARARLDAERQYGMAMRRALERNANEVRFVRGLGMGFMRG